VIIEAAELGLALLEEYGGAGGRPEQDGDLGPWDLQRVCNID
jgi:hypothetical protein